MSLIIEKVNSWNTLDRVYPPFIYTRENWWIIVWTVSNCQVFVPYSEVVVSLEPNEATVFYKHYNDWDCNVGDIKKSECR